MPFEFWHTKVEELTPKVRGLVASVHPVSERANSRKLTVASSHPYAPLRECMGAYMDRMRPHTGVYGSACCENSWQSVTGCCSRVAGELVLCSPARPL